MPNPQTRSWGINAKLSIKGQAANRVGTLKEITGIKDDDELIRQALQVYEYLVLEHILGTEFYKKDTDGRMIPHPFF